MPTIKDVARIAGVSVCTVSHAIHGTRPVKVETRQRILVAAEQIGFRPNRLARGLKTKRTHTVGFLVSHVRVPSVGILVTGAEEVLVAHGYSPILSCTHLETSFEFDALRTLTDLRVDGLLAAGSSQQFVTRMADFHDLPVVLVHSHADRGCPDRVDVDDRRAMETATRHLLSLGHRRIGFVGRASTRAVFAARKAGYSQALVGHGVPVDASLVCDVEPDPLNVEAELGRILALSPRPTALVVAHDQLFFEVFVSLKRQGIRIPDDIALVGMGDDSWTQVIDPPLTRISVPSLAVGRTAAELLISRLEGRAPKDPQSVLLEAPLVIGRSCGTSATVLLDGNRGLPPGEWRTQATGAD